MDYPHYAIVTSEGDYIGGNDSPTLYESVKEAEQGALDLNLYDYAIINVVTNEYVD